MKKFSLPCVLLLLLLLPLCLPVFLVEANAAAVTVTAQSVALMEKETGTLLYAENEHEQLAPASVTKVMTLLLTMEAIDDGRLHYEDMLSTSEHAASMGGSQVYLKAGEQMSVEDLLKAVCLASGNDAAVCLAEGIAGSEEAFVERMNARASELGMADTHFVNCTGLPAEGHVTSAYDIALMSRELVLNHPDIRNFTTLWMDTLRNGEFQLANTNKLIRYYEGATGLKTGSTDEALYCLSATAERDGMELIATVMKAPTSNDRFETAKNLLTYGFANYALLDVYPDEALPTVPVTMGKQEAVQPVFEGSNRVLLEKTKVSAIEKSVQLEESVAAPVEKGQTIGTLTVTAEGETVATLPLVAAEEVARLTYWDVVKNLLACAVFIK
jgi:D-alanyl-D-alanine carboxypeptidase (penicillin-binding protein 5/6)